jgi:transcriptional regulator with XRE-family HTH domain
MRDLPEAVAAYLKRAGISQVELANRARVSQATVSRAQSGPPGQHGRAQAQLFRYIQSQLSEETLPPTLTAAVSSAWDRTEEHAEALAALISASRQLWPGLRGSIDDDEV